MTNLLSITNIDSILPKFYAVANMGDCSVFVTEHDLVDVATSALITGDEFCRLAFYGALPYQGAKLINRALTIINAEIRAGHTNGAWTGSADLRALKTAQWGFEQALVKAAA